MFCINKGHELQSYKSCKILLFERKIIWAIYTYFRKNRGNRFSRFVFLSSFFYEHIKKYCNQKSVTIKKVQ